MRTQIPKRLRKGAVLLLWGVLLLFQWMPVRANQGIELEYQVKAAFTLNFIKLMDWPTPVTSDSSNTFNIAVMGSGELHSALTLLEGKTLNGKTIRINHVQSLDHLKDSHVLVILPSEAENLGRITDFARNHSILTISEIDGFCESGGVINLVIVEDSVNFIVNLGVARASNISISYRLLDQAYKVLR